MFLTEGDDLPFMMPEMVETARVDNRRDAAALARENRILLGVCFVAVVLLGPLFMAGYLVGRKTAAEDARVQAEVTALRDSAPEQSAQSLPAAAHPKEAAKPKAVSVTTSNQPPLHGTYLQLAAVPKNQDYIERLHADGFDAVVLEIPAKPGLYRVLVGPLPEAALAQTRAQLDSKGLPGKSAIRRVF